MSRALLVPFRLPADATVAELRARVEQAKPAPPVTVQRVTGTHSPLRTSDSSPRLPAAGGGSEGVAARLTSAEAPATLRKRGGAHHGRRRDKTAEKAKAGAGPWSAYSSGTPVGGFVEPWRPRAITDPSKIEMSAEDDRHLVHLIRDRRLGLTQAAALMRKTYATLTAAMERLGLSRAKRSEVA